jgi:hypothetical protein
MRYEVVCEVFVDLGGVAFLDDYEHALDPVALEPLHLVAHQRLVTHRQQRQRVPLRQRLKTTPLLILKR